MRRSYPTRPFDPSPSSTPSLPLRFGQEPGAHHGTGMPEPLGQLPSGGEYCVNNRDRNDQATDE
jgi:hypothetical protein